VQRSVGPPLNRRLLQPLPLFSEDDDPGIETGAGGSSRKNTKSR